MDRETDRQIDYNKGKENKFITMLSKEILGGHFHFKLIVLSFFF